MRAYLIDEIHPSQMEKIHDFLKKNAISSRLDDIFWVKIPENLLSNIQLEHINCRPHVFTVELGAEWIKLEFFVRSLSTMRCSCIGYCTEAQRNYILDFAHNTIDSLGINT